jgi:hypothetical protein
MDLDRLIGKNWSAVRQAARAFLDESHPDALCLKRKAHE